MKKIVLLRRPDEVVSAYYRAAKKRIHGASREILETGSMDEWHLVARKTGLYDELNKFYYGWQKNEGRKCHIIHYYDLLKEPGKMCNHINSIFGLPTVDGEIVLDKKRYSRTNMIQDWAAYLRKRLKK